MEPGTLVAPKRHLVISLEEPQVTLDVAGRTVILYVGQLPGADFPWPLARQSSMIMEMERKVPNQVTCPSPQVLARKVYL